MGHFFKGSSMMRRFIVGLCLFFGCAPFALAADAVLKPNDFLAICGDSITEQRQYSVFIEDYLLMCKPVREPQVMQFGWSGETAEGFFTRMENDVLRFKPSIATTCYGMNDGHYAKLSDATSQGYRDNMNKVVETFTMNSVRVVIGSPGCVDSTTFRRAPGAEEYNKTLAAERDIAREIAQQRKCPFADVYQAMYDTMQKAKAKFGADYPVAGPDGIHPNINGHLIMAYAFLKALAVSGDIGTITVDLTANKATGSDGHLIQSFDKGIVTVQSSRYPFCFLPDRENPDDLRSPNSMRGIIEFFPFNPDLNRFMLIVHGARAKMKITWGDSSKEFSPEALDKGINLAAEFLDNPFVEPFSKVHKLVQTQQEFETPMIKNMVHSASMYRRALGDNQGAVTTLTDDLTRFDKTLFNTAAASVTPVTHTIKIEAVK
jgi:lysophospholipase L1-like esterase